MIKKKKNQCITKVIQMKNGKLSISQHNKTNYSFLNWGFLLCYITLKDKPLFKSTKNIHKRVIFKPPKYRQLLYFTTELQPLSRSAGGCRREMILTHVVPNVCDSDCVSPKTAKKKPFLSQRLSHILSLSLSCTHARTYACMHTRAYTH